MAGVTMLKKQFSPSVAAFLDMLAYAEGTRGIGDDGYNVLFGSTRAAPRLFRGYADHPRIKTWEKNDEFVRNGRPDYTTAAGRYQILARMFDAYKKLLGLTDFSPPAQDAIAVQMMRERGALPHIEAGRLREAIRRCAPIWASLPGAGYGQPERKITQLEAVYAAAGGYLETGR